jgi:hypothetical protein
MSLSVILSVSALAVSILALLVSILLTTRQIRLLRDANHIPAIVNLLSEFKDPELHQDYRYVTQQLRTEHQPQLGLSGLPEPARSSVIRVAYYFNTFAFLVGFGIIDERRLFMTGVGDRIIAVWDAIRPYVEQERKQDGFRVLAMLENLRELADARRIPPGIRLLHEHQLLRKVARARRRRR